MTIGTHVTITSTGKTGTFVGWYGQQAVVKLPDGKTQALPAEQVIATEQRAEPKNLSLTAPDDMSEEEVQAQAIADLRRAGWIVLQTSVRYFAQCCRECGSWFRPEGGTGQTAGIPDLLVSHETWPLGVWLGVEMKNAGGELSPEQDLLRLLGRIVIARSRTEVLAHAQAACHEFTDGGLQSRQLDTEAIAAARARVEAKQVKSAIKNAQRKRGRK
jgi:hypothetical protein